MGTATFTGPVISLGGFIERGPDMVLNCDGVWARADTQLSLV